MTWKTYLMWLVRSIVGLLTLALSLTILGSIGFAVGLFWKIAKTTYHFAYNLW